MTNHWNKKINHPNGSVQNNKDPKKDIKFGQMSRFCSLFSSIEMAYCIKNSCHKAVRLIRNTALKLCADCAKQFVRNAQNCGKTNHGFCTMMTQRVHIYMLVREFLARNKTAIMPQPPYLQDLASADFLLFPKRKTLMKGKGFATIEEIKEKWK